MKKQFLQRALNQKGLSEKNPLIPEKKTNKFGAKKTEYKGKTFDSKKEANYCAQLDSLKKATSKRDKVISYETQIPFVVYINEKKIFTYKLDFKVEYADGRTEYVDVKGYKKGASYQIFRIKKKAVEAYFDITIKEV